MEFPDAEEWEFVNIDYKNPERLIAKEATETWTEITYLKPRPQFYKSFAEIASQNRVFEDAKGPQPPMQSKLRKMKNQQADVACDSSSNVSEEIGKQVPKRFKKHMTRKVSSEIKKDNRRRNTRKR